MRLYVIRACLIFFFVCILARLFYWQIIRGDELTVKAEGQHFETKDLEARRGNILYSDGFILASTKRNFLMFGQPKVIKGTEKDNVATLLAKTLSKGDVELETSLKTEVLNNLTRDLYWVPLKKNLTLEDKELVESLNLKGIGFEEGSSRFYPEGSSSAHLLGFVANNARGEPTGYFGVEGHYNGELKGITGNLLLEKDALGLPLLIGKFLSSEAKNGKDLNLNIDRTVQFYSEQVLKKGVAKYGAKAGSVIVMDPKTGAILALAAYPNYDPGEIERYPKENFKNPVVADSYEPGSTFKVLTMAAAINEDVLQADTRCDICASPVEISGFTIKTWNDKYQENATMTDVIVHSDNTGMVFTSRKLGLEKFYNYIENFGFGSPTSIDLQDESSPSLRPKKEWREIDLATASFGQGIAVTPIQMVTAVSAIANGGFLMEPHVVKEVKGEGGSFQIKPKKVRQVLNPATTKVITEMMVAAVEEGESKFLKPKGYKVAGKTGTAQIPVAGHYDPTKTIASFVGFAPADDPKFVMLVRYDQPSSSIYGSETAAPTFFEIAKELFPYFKIAPTEGE